MSYRIPIIFDTDIGVDDAFALLLAAGNPSIDILGITTVFGNNSVDNCTENALRICELLDLDVPVAKGARKSLFGEEKDYTLLMKYSSQELQLKLLQFVQLTTEQLVSVKEDQFLNNYNLLSSIS